MSMGLSNQRYLKMLHDCDGFYETPMNSKGRPLGPFVGYSGRYTDEATGQQLQYVGTRYFNLAKLEEYPKRMSQFAEDLTTLIKQAGLIVDCIVGVPEGGLILGYTTADFLAVRYAGLQKQITALATDTTKAQTQLVFGRHEVETGMRVALCEDLVNNFSTTDKAIAAVEAAGAVVVALVCGLNRSEHTEYNGLPVVSVVHLPTPQYRQDNPLVAPYLESPGVVWDVKPRWAELRQAMAEHAGK